MTEPKPSVGRIVHLVGSDCRSTYGNDIPACVAAIVTGIHEDGIYATPFTSPESFVESGQPYSDDQWHWPERA